MTSKHTIIIALAFVALFLSACSTPAAHVEPESPIGEPVPAAAEEEEPEAQSEQAALQIVCDSVKQPQIQEVQDPSDQAVALVNYIEANVTNAAVVDFFTQAASMSPEARSSTFQQMLERNGIESCAFAGGPGDGGDHGD